MARAIHPALFICATAAVLALAAERSFAKVSALEATRATSPIPGTGGTLGIPIPALVEIANGKAEETIDLKTAVQRALQAATAVQKAKNDVDLTGKQLIQGYAQFLPNLLATGAFNQATGQQYFTTAQPAFVDGKTVGGNYQISTTLNIFNGFNDYASLKASLARKRASDLSLARAKQQIALDVEQSFLQTILDSEIVRIARKNLASSQAREERLAEQAKVGVRNMADLFQQQAATSSDEAFLTNSQDKERTDQLLLIRKLRLDAEGRYRFTPPSFGPVAGLDERFADEKSLIQTAIAARPDLKARDDQYKAFQWDVTSARSLYFPRLDFGANVIGGGRTISEQIVNGVDVTPASQPSIASQFQTQQYYTVGLVLTWNIFDRFTTRVSTERASVQATNSRLDYEDLKNQVVAEVRQAYGDYRAVLQQLESSRKGLVAASKAFELVEGRYKLGSASFVDLAVSQATLVQADAAHAQAQISFALQTRTLETVLGTADVEIQ